MSKFRWFGVILTVAVFLIAAVTFRQAFAISEITRASGTTASRAGLSRPSDPAQGLEGRPSAGQAPLDACFDVSLADLKACRAEEVMNSARPTATPDVCFDVSLWETCSE
jgi:hypothetical protein